ncbi:MAG: tetratricopeptide repeat protein, partial [Lentisphaeria bacterium]|nr:tetratricopeptide repeat protein [Lentisphaeria bacterium]
NIGGVYSRQGNHAAALDYYQKALAIQQKTLPDNHTDIATCYNNIGIVYFRKGEYRNAYNHINKAYEIFRSKLGDNHPTTQQVLDDLKFVEQKLKKSGQ